MDAIERTKKHAVREYLPLTALVKNDKNPNKMSARQFDLLCNNIQQLGFVDPIYVRPLEGGVYRIIGGHHRYDAAEYLGFEEVPVVINTDPEFDEEQETFQLVRMNVIAGKLDPEKFMMLYNEAAAKGYEADIIQEMFGFADEKEFQKLIQKTAEGLPDELKDTFKEAVKEVKTIQDLAKVLNHLFTNYGDTLDYGYMIFDFDGKKSIWLRLQSKQLLNFKVLADKCKLSGRALDHVMGQVLQSIANGELDSPLEGWLKASPVVDTGKGELPVLDEIEKNL